MSGVRRAHTHASPTARLCAPFTASLNSLVGADLYLLVGDPVVNHSRRVGEFTGLHRIHFPAGQTQGVDEPPKGAGHVNYHFGVPFTG